MNGNNSAEIIGLTVGIIVWILNKLKDKHSDIWLYIIVLKNNLMYLINKLIRI